MTQKRAFSKILDLHHREDPWLIMVHGFSHTSDYFAEQVKFFQQHYRLFLTDLRGHGRSSEMEGPFGVEEYADDISQLLDEAGVRNGVYWGTHTGSAIGLILALRHPSLFSKIILEGAYLPGFPMPRVGELLGRAREIAHNRSIAEAVEDWLAHADWFDYMNAHPRECRVDELRKITRTFKGAPWLSESPARAVTPAAVRLHEITQPVLIYNGKFDIPDFKATAEYMKENLPNAHCAEIQHGGGFPGWEAPNEVNDLVSQFLFAQ